MIDFPLVDTVHAEFEHLWAKIMLCWQQTLSPFFSTFVMVNTTDKSTLRLVKILKVTKFYRHLYDGGLKLAPTIITSVNVRNFAELYLCSLKTCYFKIKQFSNYIKALFPVVSTNCP